MVGGSMNFNGLVGGCVGAFLSTWITWFCFVKREPSCCFCCVCVEDFKFMHLIYGILLILNGVSQLYNYIMGPTGLLTMLSVITEPWALVFAIGVSQLYNYIMGPTG